MPCLARVAWLVGLAIACPGLADAQVPDEVPGLGWCPGSRVCLQWSAVEGATNYSLYRGEQASAPCVVHDALDSCLEGTFTTTSTGEVVNATTDPGRLFWFLVTAVNDAGEGSAGNAGPVQRRLNSASTCFLSCAATGEVCGVDEECCSMNCVGGFCAAACSHCPVDANCWEACTYGPQQESGQFDPNTTPFPDEVSGVVQSRVDPQVLWMHNDDSGQARLLAYTSTGTRLGLYRVRNTPVTDPEDIAAGPGPVPGEKYVYFGDVGGRQSSGARIWGCTEANSSDPAAGCGDCPVGDDCQQRIIEVLLIVEPLVSASQDYKSANVDAEESILFRFPDTMLGHLQNVETLMLDPLTLDLYFVTKSTNPPRVFRAGYPYSGTVTLEDVAELDGLDGEVTGGDISSDGHYVAVRTGTTAYVWERPLGTDLRDVFTLTRCGSAGPIPEPKGEAIGFDLDNSASFYTVSEAEGMTQVYIYYFERE